MLPPRTVRSPNISSDCPISLSMRPGAWAGLVLVLVLAGVSYAQIDTAWTFKYAGAAGTNYEPLASFVDSRSATSYVYVAGWAEQPTGEVDALLLKITADSGHFVWAKTYYNMTASGAAMDTSGNIYIAGITHGTSAAGKICILKYSPSGDTWTRTYGEQGLSFTSVGTIALDSSQNVYAGGCSDSAVRIVKYLPNGMLAAVDSFAPSSPMRLWGGQFHILNDGEAYLATTVERPSGNLGCLVAKLSNQGLVWERTYRDTGSDYEWMRWSEVDSDASIYFTGEAESAVYGTEDFCTTKVNSLGATVWTAEYIGPEGLRAQPRFMLLSNGSVYVAGWSVHKYMGENEATALVKYDSLGNQQWARRFGAEDDSDADVGYEFFSDEGSPKPHAYSINADDSGNVYLTGDLTHERVIGCDMFLLKYNPQGSLVWFRDFGYPAQLLHGATVTIDRTGSIYNVGICEQEGTNTSILVVKYLGGEK